MLTQPRIILRSNVLCIAKVSQKMTQKTSTTRVTSGAAPGVPAASEVIFPVESLVDLLLDVARHLHANQQDITPAALVAGLRTRHPGGRFPAVGEVAQAILSRILPFSSVPQAEPDAPPSQPTTPSRPAKAANLKEVIETMRSWLQVYTKADLIALLHEINP